MDDFGLYQDLDFLNLLKEAKRDFYLNSCEDDFEELISDIPEKQLKMIKLLAMYILTNQDKKTDVIENVKLLYKGKHIFDWLEDKNHEFYQVLNYFKRRLDVIMHQGNKLFILRNHKNEKIDTNHPLYKQILFEKLFILSLGKKKEINAKLSAINDSKLLQHHNYISQSIDWLKIVQDLYKEEDSEVINNGHDFTVINVPTLADMLPMLADKDMSYNLDIKQLKKMSRVGEKKQLLKKYFRVDNIGDTVASKNKRKLEDTAISSESQQQPKKKKKAARKVVLDPNANRKTLKK